MVQKKADATAKRERKEYAMPEAATAHRVTIFIRAANARGAKKSTDLVQPGTFEEVYNYVHNHLSKLPPEKLATVVRFEIRATDPAAATGIVL